MSSQKLYCIYLVKFHIVYQQINVVTIQNQPFGARRCFIPIILKSIVTLTAIQDVAFHQVNTVILTVHYYSWRLFLTPKWFK